MNTAQHSYPIENITWEETADPEYPYRAQVNQDNYLIRLNDFPAESLYTLIVNGEEVEDIDDWPESWVRLGDSQDKKVEQSKEITPDNKTSWGEWGRRITRGDTDAVAELYNHYRDGVAIIINQIVHSESITDDLSQETFRISLEKIRRGEVRKPERLSGFICGVARFLALDYMRKMRRAQNQGEAIEAEQIRDPQPDPYDHLLRKERAELVRQTLSEIKIERDREVLSRYFIAEEDKDQICADLGLTRQHFNNIIYHGLKRLKQHYLARDNKAN